MLEFAAQQDSERVEFTGLNRPLLPARQIRVLNFSRRVGGLWNTLLLLRPAITAQIDADPSINFLAQVFVIRPSPQYWELGNDEWGSIYMDKHLGNHSWLRFFSVFVVSQDFLIGKLSLVRSALPVVARFCQKMERNLRKEPEPEVDGPNLKSALTLLSQY